MGDSPHKPHNLKVLQSDRTKLKKQLKILTVRLNNYIFNNILEINAVCTPIRHFILFCFYDL